MTVFRVEHHHGDMAEQGVVLDTLAQSQSVDAGHIGNYDSCLNYSRVIGTWRPLENSKPYIGNLNEISEQPEIKVEVNIKSEKLDETIKAIRKIHPYEEPVINILPLYIYNQ